MTVEIYTDGACQPTNPGPGGYAAILKWKGHSKELTGAERETTNNRMEMMGVIVALEAIKRPCPHRIEVFTDSTYVRDGITKWVVGWQKKGWKTKGKKEVANRDLWERMLEAKKGLKVTFNWVRGHAGNPLNERADKLATSACREGATQ